MCTLPFYWSKLGPLITNRIQRFCQAPPDKRMQDFHSTSYEIVEFNTLWISNFVQCHLRLFTTIQHHSTWWSNVCNMLNLTKLNTWKEICPGRNKILESDWLLAQSQFWPIKRAEYASCLSYPRQFRGKYSAGWGKGECGAKKKKKKKIVREIYPKIYLFPPNTFKK